MLEGCSVMEQVAGRTDAGVHANGQAVQFFLTAPLPPAECANMHVRLNKLLPPDIRVLSVCRTPPDFSVRLSPIFREYHYLLAWGDVEHPLGKRFCGFEFGELDVAAMEEVVDMFEGTHDFSAFSNARNDAKSTTRHVFTARIVRLEEYKLRFEVCPPMRSHSCGTAVPGSEVTCKLQ
jgi:tRNA pseudouridine38-40 synthase